MIGRALNSNNDIFIADNGQFETSEDGAEVLQHVRTRLLAYTNEWFLDLTSGTPYFEQIFVKPANLVSIELILKRRILNTPGVLRLISFDMDYIGEGIRRLTVDFAAETTFGNIDSNNVSINI